MTRTRSVLQGLFVLLSGDGPAQDPDELAEATRELEAALAALKAARAGWSGSQTVDLAAVRRALDLAERQLDAARVRLERAGGSRKG